MVFFFLLFAHRVFVPNYRSFFASFFSPSLLSSPQHHLIQGQKDCGLDPPFFSFRPPSHFLFLLKKKKTISVSRMGRGRQAFGAVTIAAAAGFGGWTLSRYTLRDRLRVQQADVYKQQLRSASYRPVDSSSPETQWGKMTPITCENGSQIELWAPPPRAEQLNSLENTDFDLLVIGGGATGSGIALDASLRGLKVAVVEKDDFAAGTSSRSTKLIHGGIRYLLLTFQKKMPNELSDIFTNLTFNRGNYDVVRSDLYERAHMIQSAPFMTRPLPMMVPMYKYWEVPVLWFGGKMYDALAGSRRLVPSSHYMTREEAQYRFPTLSSTDSEGNSLKGCLVIYDGQMNDARMNLNIALTACQHGAVVANHTKVEKLALKQKMGAKNETYQCVRGATVTDMLTGRSIDIKAKQVINATGPFSDSIRKMADPDAEDIIVSSQGAHLILPDYVSPEAMGFVRMTSDGRVLYFLPWEGSTIAGTTDHPAGVVDHPSATENEVEFIIRESNAVLNRPVHREQVRATWAGLRPLVKNPAAKDTKEIAREHVVELTGGLVTVCGGKWTTYRRMAEDALDYALEQSPGLKAKAGECRSLDSKLIGADRDGLVCGGDFAKIVITLREEYDFSKEVSQHLVSNYGTRALQIAQIAQNLETTRMSLHNDTEALNYRKLCSRYPMLEAEVVFACQHEYAETVWNKKKRGV